MNKIQLEQIEGIRQRYAEMLVEGMDMNLLIEFAEDCIVKNLKCYDIEDLKDEIIDCYGEETWTDMSS